ncbi:uncharacterized protein BDCG_08018 [Blastomyces dermatitidis ER-3]|uniref:Uncharacterized protein n=2 Tax=Ajellomyces dermatitidis TaxID=5039 RepID=F2TJR0_AJEDA|nr:uncharacterized protein BDCG_08018 [Blastomyces dermatitidis ER-3]EEQ84749.2 hypothetical protein BDCG_08018 [Blastomyces dermatitidis ER-3]EGE83465.2 hypothetical protein BDDG_06409 [Blastomyces dermatitidis ATCC 18188]
MSQHHATQHRLDSRLQTPDSKNPEPKNPEPRTHPPSEAQQQNPPLPTLCRSSHNNRPSKEPNSPSSTTTLHPSAPDM